MAKEIEESVKIFELFDFSFGNRREMFLWVIKLFLFIYILINF